MLNPLPELPRYRFRGDGHFQPKLTPSEVIKHIQAGGKLFYHAPMDHSPKRVYATGKLKLWKRDPNRFSIRVETSGTISDPGCRFTIDNGHIDRLRIANAEWWHGITATARHAFKLDNGYTSHGTRARLLKHGVWTGSRHVPVKIIQTQVELHQSNGFVHYFDKLAHAVTFARRSNFQLTVHGPGKRIKVLVHARAMNGEYER